MALERINPFEKEDRFCLDHLLRYYWACQFVRDCSVLDVACGTGFGAAMLGDAGAHSVLGVDCDKETIAGCARRSSTDRINFQVGNIEELKKLGTGSYDRVVCFETLEHIKDPAAALQSIRSVLSPGGVLVGSVPGETDMDEDNVYHLQHYTQESLKTLLMQHFTSVEILLQNFHLGSVIEAAGRSADKSISHYDGACYEISLDQATRAADSILFLASNSKLPDAGAHMGGFSRQAWIAYSGEYRQTAKGLKQQNEKFKDLFFQFGDLKRRFSNTLAWGRYHFKMAHGEPPDADYVQKIERAQSEREQSLREQLEKRNLEINDLKKRLSELKDETGQRVASRSGNFSSDFKELTD